ncbi:MAG TPA: helix-turn-helix transcriptional regulator [Gemmatimonadaceae bacterium]|nr:helix-turn-helix transcriptional regulator [Gemmatimonadaceae bacterium]
MPETAERRFAGAVSLVIADCGDAGGILTVRITCSIPNGELAPTVIELAGAVESRNGDVTVVGYLPLQMLGAAPARRGLGAYTPPDDRVSRLRLTTREADVARLLAQGQSNARIASLLAISPHTARRHTEAVMLKLGVHSRAAVGPALRGERV